MQNVGLTISGNQIQTARHANTFFVKINRENFLVYVVLTSLRLLFHRKEMALWNPEVVQNCAPHMENRVHGESSRTAGGVDQALMLLRIQHLHAEINVPARREV